MSRVFANGLEDRGSNPGLVIPKTQKMVLDAALLNTQHYKVRIEDKVEQCREGVTLSPKPLLKREPLGYPRTKVADCTVRSTSSALYTRGSFVMA